MYTGKNGLTERQQAMFWAVFNKACAAQGLFTTADKTEYRHRILEEETGVVSLLSLSRTTDFDRVMFRVACDAGDFEQAANFSVSDARRMGYLIKVCCCQLMQLKGGDEAEARQYLGGLLDQARVPNGTRTDDNSYWMDCTIDQSHKVFQMLDTHRRRLLRGLFDGRTARGFLSFDPTLVYHPLPSGGVRLRYDAHAYDTLTHIRINLRSAAA